MDDLARHSKLGCGKTETVSYGEQSREVMEAWEWWQTSAVMCEPEEEGVQREAEG